ncbi:MAG: penicillin-binding protein 2 [Polyangiaceae bacterium]
MSLLVRRSDTTEFRKRFRWIGLAMVLAFLGIIIRLFSLQILEGEEYRAIARENIIRRITLATTRGQIFDRNGKVLARSRPAHNLYVVPKRMDMSLKCVPDAEESGKPPKRTCWTKLVGFLGIGEDERSRLEQKLNDIRASDGPRKDQQILLKEDVSRDVMANLKTHETELPGVAVVSVPVRFYPNEEVGAHLLGYMAEVDAEKLAALQASGYIEGDRIGITGIERAWESYLRGTRGWEKVLVDARGRRRPGGEEIIEEPRRVDPIPGRDLRLTIDIDIVKAMDVAFRGELAGGVVLIDVRTGRILGMYSKPGYDPNALSGGSGKQVIRDAFRRLYLDPLKSALDKTVAGAYPPGSTFKPITALAALEKGLIDARQFTQCRGGLAFGKRTFRCTHVHGGTDLHKAIAESCNVYFYRLAAEYGVGMDVIAEMGQQFGLGTRTGLGVNAEAAGRMPTRAWMTLRNKGQFRLGFSLNAAIGQGATTVTVLQLALAYAALANGGTLFQPQIVGAVETSAGTVVQEFSPRVRRQIDVRPENFALVQKALFAGVNETTGTAWRARLAGVEMAGKTGTAQVSHHVVRGQEAEKVWYFNREHAWFAGYSPTRAPEVAVVALVEHGGAGGKHAAPIAFEVVKAYQDLKAARSAGKRSPTAKDARPASGGSP